MKYFLPAVLLVMAITGLRAQTDTTELRKPPVLSDLPIVFDRNQLKDELTSIKKPLYTPEEIITGVSSIDTRFGSQPAITMQIPEVTLEQVEKTWSRNLKKNADGKLQREGNVLFIEDVVLEEVSSEAMDIEMQFAQLENGVRVDMALSRDSIIMTQQANPGEYSAMTDYLRSAALEAYREKVEEDLKAERKEMDDLDKELSNLVKDNEKLHKEITDSNLDINKTNMEIDQNEVEIKMVTKDVINNRAAVSQARNKDIEKEAKKTLRDSEKQKKNLEKERGKLYENIVARKREIAENEQAITLNLDDQKEMLILQYKQSLEIEAIKDKLDKIR